MTYPHVDPENAVDDTSVAALVATKLLLPPSLAPILRLCPIFLLLLFL